ncbi:MAG: hypothetical protein LBU58_10500, partial [Clostridiales bacterium]|nr:hypothetical protein [Clostridiales bacterium]
MKKRTRILWITVAVLLVFAGCQTSGGQTATTTAAPAATTAAAEVTTSAAADAGTSAAAGTSADAAGDVGYGSPDVSYDEHLTISMTSLDVEKSGKTARDQWLFDKFNITFDLIPVTWGDWTEKVRVMVAGDDIPDILWWDMKINHTAEFRGWAEAGAFREIGALDQWPNLQRVREALVSDDKMLTLDGKLYGWPTSRNNPEW